MDVDAAFGPLRAAFPHKAEFQGTHFKYAERDGAVLIETRKFNPAKNSNVHFYWILVGGHFELVNASELSRLAPMKTIGESFGQFFPPR